MGYIRSRETELTGYQEGAPWSPQIDVQCDFVMVYGLNDTTEARIARFREKGYVVHLMTGVSWGAYQDYLYGGWDGREHWDEAQTQRDGKPILHGIDVPYMVPTIAFADYLTEKLKKAVDTGVVAIHLEEPEFWDRGGYSPAFQREYQLYYRQSWQPPHSSLDARYKAARLKAYLYARALSRISSALKEYAMVKYGRVLRIYVPTHSLVNYTQWKIMSPEGALIDIPSLDGYIAQIWTGTSRPGNVYGGMVRERTFETAFLEYGIMQELVKGTGREMWFLHDPIEDWPEYTWEDYRRNYIMTVAASLLHPKVHKYEICPWPTRVYNGVFPRKAGLAGGTIPTTPMPGAKPIAPEYASLLNGIGQMLGDMDQEHAHFENGAAVGLLMSDSCLFQRSYPDGVLRARDGEEGELSAALSSLTKRHHGGEDTLAESRALMARVSEDPELLGQFIASGAFPNFYGMALPLLKHGLPVRPVQLDNVRRFPGYLEDYGQLIVSYEYMKPESPDVNNALASWVRAGGTLMYVGNGQDPYHDAEGWWNTGAAAYQNPAQHLMELLDLPPMPQNGVYPVGKGFAAVLPLPPALICTTPELAQSYRDFVKSALSASGKGWTQGNHLTLHRGPYTICCVMEESVSEAPQVLRGLFVDMMDSGYPVLREKTVHPGECAVLFDLFKIEEEVRIIGTTARIFGLDVEGSGFTLTAKAADLIPARIRLRLPKRVFAVSGADTQGNCLNLSAQWDEDSRTVLISYPSANQEVVIKGQFA